MSIAARVVGDLDANSPFLGMTAIKATGAAFQRNNAKLHVPGNILSINDNIKFLGNMQDLKEQFIRQKIDLK